MEHYQILVTLEKKETHEYDIYKDVNDEGEVYSMYYSNDLRWSEHIRGKLVQEVIDDGNGFKFKNPLNKKSLDYNQAVELHVLMSFIHKIEGSFKGKIVKVEKIYDL